MHSSSKSLTYYDASFHAFLSFAYSNTKPDFTEWAKVGRFLNLTAGAFTNLWGGLKMGLGICYGNLCGFEIAV